jgi:hypothetical protein
MYAADRRWVSRDTIVSDEQIQLLLSDSKANNHARGRGNTQQVSIVKTPIADSVVRTLGNQTCVP